jgi:hypothetical protein
MIISMRLGGATAEEARDFLVAYQRTRAYGLPHNGAADKPTVEMLGIGWTITTPPMTPDRAGAMAALLNYGTEGTRCE